MIPAGPEIPVAVPTGGRRPITPRRYHGDVGDQPPDGGDDWVGLTTETLPLEQARVWSERPDCGAVVLFTGTVRNFAAGRPSVSALEYEAYEEEVEPRLAAVAVEARRRWPGVGRTVLLHRVGRLAVGEASVAVVVSAPHRDEAFAAARYCIDAVKESVPIWKREEWDGGADWSPHASPVTEVVGP